MLDDLKELSDAYISEIQEMTQRGHHGWCIRARPSTAVSKLTSGITYGESETSRRQDAILRQNTNDRYKSSPTAYSTPESQSGYPPRPAYPMAPSQPAYPMAPSQPSYAPQASYAPEAIYATQPAYNSSYSTPSSQSQYPAGSTSGYPQYPGYAPVDTSRERAPYRYGYSSYGDPNEAIRKDHRLEPRLAPSVIASGPSYGDEPIRDPYRNEAVREERLPDLRGAYSPKTPTGTIPSEKSVEEDNENCAIMGILGRRGSP